MSEQYLEELKPSANLPRGLAPLGYRDFALYWIGLATTNTGRWIELTGLLWLVYEITDSPLLVGLLGAARALPALLLSPIAGVIADRVNQRGLLFITQGLALVCSLGLALLVVSGRIELWHIYTQVLIQTAINSFDAAGRQALFPRLVPRSVLPKAVTLSITASRVSKFLGPALGGFLIAGLGEASPFFANAISFVALMVAVAMMKRLAPTMPRKAASFGREMLDGLGHIFSTPVLSGILKLEIVFGLFEMNPAMIAVIAREILDAGPRTLGLLLSAPALGSFVGIFWLLYAQRMGRQGRLGLICTFAYSCMLAFLAFSSSYVISFIALAVIGVLEVLVAVTRNTVMQLAAPAHMRGRVMANMGMITRGTGPLAETQSGFLASAIGPNPAILIAAGVIAAAASLTAIFNRELWRFSLDDKSTSP